MTAVTEIWSYRNLIVNLAQRELRARYKKSVLGWLWSLLNPAAMLAILSLVFGTFLRFDPPVAGNGELQVFALYLFAALVVWNYFNSTVTGAIASLQASGGLLNKVHFPPACPAIANTITVLIQAGIEASILALVMIVAGNVAWTFLLVVPLFVLLTLFAVGIGLALSVYNIYYRDVGYLVGIGMQLLFYATPIIYPPSTLEGRTVRGVEVIDIVNLNPIAQYVEWSRDAFYDLRWPSLANAVAMTLVSVGVFVVGLWLFNRKSRAITEEL